MDNGCIDHVAVLDEPRGGYGVLVKSLFSNNGVFVAVGSGDVDEWAVVGCHGLFL
jgi:hypothetical protein